MKFHMLKRSWHVNVYCRPVQSDAEWIYLCGVSLVTIPDYTVNIHYNDVAVRRYVM